MNAPARHIGESVKSSSKLVCTVVYVIPRIAMLGAILLTGYLGGAVATHERVGAGLFQVIFPSIFGALIWGRLYLRDDRLRVLIPLRNGGDQS